PHCLWWCHTGILMFLPIHAAGLYRKHGSDRASDYIISSYSPTLSALLDPLSNPVDRFQMTVLIQPHTPLLSVFPGTETELTQIQKRVPEQWLTSLGGVAPTTVDLAKAHLRKSSIVHFACHGMQDLANPLDSSLVLTDGLLTINHIMHGRHGSSKSPGSVSTEKSMLLAFLSACEAEKGDERIPDEAMHLAATAAQVSCLTENEKAVLKSRESRQKGLIEEQEQRKNKRRKVTWGYSTAKRAKS
ncbi:hypothetical protein B0H10DRAFT_2300698, partial [Mycena sp. CBHHK59/15]